MHNTKEKIIETGIEVLLEKGYNGAGLKEILDAADVPRGSFYHFFKNKEAFAKEALSYYSDAFKPVLQQYLIDSNEPAIQRISTFFDAMITLFDKEKKCKGGCLVGNIAQELADLNTSLRKQALRIMQAWNKYFVSCLEQAKNEGDLAKDTDVNQLAEFILNSWEGALLKMKVVGTVDPLINFNQQMTNYLKCS